MTEAAEESFRMGLNLWPNNPESITGLSKLLTRAGKESEAREVVAEFLAKYPEQKAGFEERDARMKVIRE